MTEEQSSSEYGYSLRKIILFTLPMILNSIVMSIMFVTDRTILARYSLDSMNAVSLGGSFGVLAFFLLMGITQSACIFVGQYNGMKEYSKVGHPVWQMIYFSIISTIVFVPLGIFCEHFGIFPKIYEKEGIAYLKPLLLFGMLPGISSSIAAFFVGRGQSLIVIGVFIFGNIINATLDILFVFGYGDIIPEMGAAGAAYSTIIGELSFILCFGTIFLSKKHRERFNTADYRFIPRLTKDCIRIGAPISGGKVISQLGWCTMMFCFTHTSPDLATCESFAVLIWMLFIVFSDGCSRSLTALGANLIGRNQKKQIQNLLRLFLNANFVWLAMFSVPLIFAQDPVLDFAIKINADLASIRADMSYLMITMWIVLFLDSIYYMVCAVLNSGGDTIFPMLLESVTLWLGAVIPTFVMYYTGTLTTIRTVYVLIPITQVVNAVIIIRRYNTGRWFRRLV